MRQHVIRMQDADDLACRALQALVQRIVDPVIGFAHQNRGLIGLGAQDVEGAIARSAVDDDVLDLAIGLGAEAAQRLSDRVTPVVDHGDD